MTNIPRRSGLNSAARSVSIASLLNVGLDQSTEYTTAEEDSALVTETELVTSVVCSLSPVSAIVAGVGLSRSDFIDAARTDHDIIARLGYSRTLVRYVALDVDYRYSQKIFR